MILPETGGGGASFSIDINYSKIQKSSKQQLDTRPKVKSGQICLNQVTCIYFLLMVQLPLPYLIAVAQLIGKYGMILVSITYLLLVLFVGMPLYMIIILMGQYCRKGFIKFWQCIPLLKGMGYSISAMLLLQEIINCTLTGLCILVLPELLSSDVPWKNCKFKNVTKTCVSMVDSNNKNLIKCQNMSLDVLPTFSTQNYINYNKLQIYSTLYNSELGPINQPLAVTITLIWISVSLFMKIGFRRFQKFFIGLIQLTFLALLLILIGTLFLSREFHAANKLYSNFNSLSDMEFWYYIFMHVCDRTEPGPTVYLTSITNSSLKPNVVALFVCGLKIAILFAIMLWFPLLLQNVMNHYKVVDPSCFHISGFDMLFTVVPDVLSRMPVPQLWLILWFLVIIDFGYISLVFTCTAILESLIDAHPFLNIYRSHICFILCAICCGINILIVTPLSMVIIRTWRNYGLEIVRIVILTLMTFSLIFIYSLVRISTDYHFTYEQPVSDFWIRCWKILPFLVLFQTAFVFYSHRNLEELAFTNKTLMYSSYFVAALVLLPIFIVMLCIYSKHIKHQTVSTILKAESDWGHYNINKRAARYRFNPYTEVRYKTKRLKCKHACLVHSKRFRKLQHLSNIKKFLMLAK